VSDLPELLFSWAKHLRAEGKSKATVKAYGDGIRSYIKGSEHAGVGGPAKEDVIAFLVHPVEPTARPPQPARPSPEQTTSSHGLRSKANWRYPCDCC
jgi:hypothetical protein